jgi:hypothetical protein
MKNSGGYRTNNKLYLNLRNPWDECIREFVSYVNYYDFKNADLIVIHLQEHSNTDNLYQDISKYVDKFKSVSLVTINPLYKNDPDFNVIKWDKVYVYEYFFLNLFIDGCKDFANINKNENKKFISQNARTSYSRANIISKLIKNDIDCNISWLLRYGLDLTREDVKHFKTESGVDFTKEIILDVSCEYIKHSEWQTSSFYNDSIIDISPETEQESKVVFYSEKTWRPFLHRKPYLGMCSPGHYKSLEDRGFKLYRSIFNYDFDLDYDTQTRNDIYIEEIKRINNYSLPELKQLIQSVEEEINYNYNYALEKKPLPDILLPIENVFLGFKHSKV